MNARMREPGPLELLRFSWQRVESARVGDFVTADYDEDTTQEEYDALPRMEIIGATPSDQESNPLLRASLFREFADLENPDDYAEFANKYGMLGYPTKLPGYAAEIRRLMRSKEDSEKIHWKIIPVEPVGYWTEFHRLVRFAVSTWDAIRTGDDMAIPQVGTTPVADMQGVCVSIDLEEWPFTEIARRYDGSQPVSLLRAGSGRMTVLRAALADVLSVVSKLLGISPVVGAIDGQLAPYDVGLRLTFDVDSLAAAIWLQLLLAINGNREYKRCEGCGGWWDATDARSDKITCSESCRKRRSLRAKEADHV